MTGSPTLVYAMTVRLDLAPPVMLGSPDADVLRAAVQVTGGTVDGPRIRGTVLPGSGSDFARIRPDQVVDLQAQYLIETGDGTVILVHNRGYRWAAPAVDRRLRAGEPVDPGEYYLRTAPRFEVAAGPYEWLARHVFVGVGRRTATGNVIDYHQLL